MDPKAFQSDDPIAWCPGCGNFGILNAMKKAFAASGKAPKDILMVSGIGQAAKLPHYVRANCFNGLHGRALPPACGAKIANNALTVVVSSGDGDMYGEGGNHLLHNIRRNIDITVVVHDNQVYGLTKGQASPTTEQGVVTPVQQQGVVLDPFRALEFAIAMGVGFVARGYSGEIDHLADLILRGMNYRGFAFIDVLQPCPTFNKKNTYQWFKERVYKLDSSYDPSDRDKAFEKAREWGERIPLGILYTVPTIPFDERIGLSRKPPLVDRDISNVDVSKLYSEFA